MIIMLVFSLNNEKLYIPLTAVGQGLKCSPRRTTEGLQVWGEVGVGRCRGEVGSGAGVRWGGGRGEVGEGQGWGERDHWGSLRRTPEWSLLSGEQMSWHQSSEILALQLSRGLRFSHAFPEETSQVSLELNPEAISTEGLPFRGQVASLIPQATLGKARKSDPTGGSWSLWKANYTLSRC